ncbi:glutamine synthetase III [Peptoniphilus catoniae]|uniref:glutamine synthetase III n=1 Tax=Peptoniphilus catoniae TaxID=1660341 RepID=UPI0010FDBBB6|nr:glutamine synthetase III [Peptoniphilus catoniae]
MKNRTVEEFGKMTFNKAKMKERLPYPVYLKWKDVVRTNAILDKDTADSIAHAMKEWALENGATHYTHWFSPLNGLTAKKHEAFLDRTSDFEIMNRFSGKELIKGEPDASSFPSGGMRSTFEARGYTYWDCSANSFILDNILYIPSIFLSFTGEKLDKRAPLMASINEVSKEGSRLSNILKKEEHTYRMRVKIGLEQEFFLVDKKLYDKRSDLKNCGRTIFGANPPKAQDLEDHYFGVIPERVMDFYEDVNSTLWSLGVYAKTEHNEAAPCQFELAILFENANISIDDNQLCMSVLQSTALKHGLVCLLHEKPFKGVNGSGKHNNYSLVTNYGLNVFDPGKKPEENLIFLSFSAALIEAVYKTQSLIRISSSSVSNDFRLGADEAPPAIVSLFLGRDLEDLFKSIAYDDYEKRAFEGKIKVASLGEVDKDRSDRNRTSTVAFTGNKFEFRMLGSSKMAADINIVINAGMAAALKKIADKLEGVKEDCLKDEVYKIVRDIVVNYGSVLYDGNNYSEDWIREAARRGLKNHKTFFDALCAVKDEDSYKMFYDMGILSETELKAVYEVYLEDIVKYHSLELRIAKDMVVKDIVPAGLKQICDLGKALSYVKNSPVEEVKERINEDIDKLLKLRDKAQKIYDDSLKIQNTFKTAEFLEKNVVPLLKEMRIYADDIEKMVSRENYTIPTYEDLFSSII